MRAIAAALPISPMLKRPLNVTQLGHEMARSISYEAVLLNHEWALLQLVVGSFRKEQQVVTEHGQANGSLEGLKSAEIASCEPKRAF